MLHAYVWMRMSSLCVHTSLSIVVACIPNKAKAKCLQIQHKCGHKGEITNILPILYGTTMVMMLAGVTCDRGGGYKQADHKNSKYK